MLNDTFTWNSGYGQQCVTAPIHTLVFSLDRCSRSFSTNTTAKPERHDPHFTIKP